MFVIIFGILQIFTKRDQSFLTGEDQFKLIFTNILSVCHLMVGVFYVVARFKILSISADIKESFSGVPTC